MNLRQCITRNITYTEVTVLYNTVTGESISYYVYGETTAAKEMKKILKDGTLETIPTIVCNTVTEKRAISLENFINNSIVISESEEN